MAILTGSSATSPNSSAATIHNAGIGSSHIYGNGGFLRALGEAVEAVSGGGSNSWACLPPLPAELKALRTALGDLEQRLFELGLLADLPNTSAPER